MGESPRTFLAVREVSKTFMIGEERIEALHHVSLNVDKGEFVCLIGASGCGKSTLLRIIAGFERPSAGDVRVYGAPIAGPGSDRGMVFQDYALFPWMTVRQNIAFGPRQKGLKDANDIASRYLDMVGLAKFADRYPYQLSGGMKQRVAIARVLANEASILLMDEPFGALDALTREKMNLELLRIWKEAGKTIVFVTHGISEAVFLGTRVVVLTAGPAKMADNFAIDLPHPRTLDMKTHQRFGEYSRRIYRLLGME